MVHLAVPRPQSRSLAYPHASRPVGELTCSPCLRRVASSLRCTRGPGPPPLGSGQAAIATDVEGILHWLLVTVLIKLGGSIDLHETDLAGDAMGDQKGRLYGVELQPLSSPRVVLRSSTTNPPRSPDDPVLVGRSLTNTQVTAKPRQPPRANDYEHGQRSDPPRKMSSGVAGGRQAWRERRQRRDGRCCSASSSPAYRRTERWGNQTSPAGSCGPLSAGKGCPSVRSPCRDRPSCPDRRRGPGRTSPV